MIRNPATMTQGYIGTWLLGWNQFYKIVTHPQLNRSGFYVCDVMIYDANYSFVEYFRGCVINSLKEVETRKEILQIMFCEVFIENETRAI